MKYRKLRIAWSVAWGVVAVLLVVLWVRSYWWENGVSKNISSSSSLKVFSLAGTWYVQSTYRLADDTWKVTSREVKPEQIANAKRATNGKSFGSYEYGSPKFPHEKRGILFPAWLPVLIVVMIAGLPWFQRFSLRALLIATTLVAVGLGAIIWITR